MFVDLRSKNRWNNHREIESQYSSEKDEVSDTDNNCQNIHLHKYMLYNRNIQTREKNKSANIKNYLYRIMEN